VHEHADQALAAEPGEEREAGEGDAVLREAEGIEDADGRAAASGAQAASTPRA
jgi:hypothetical protein